MGPVAVKSYPGKQLVHAHPTISTPAERAKQEIDDGRREKAGYVFGALQPQTGEVLTATYRRRTLVNWIDFLQHLVECSLLTQVYFRRRWLFVAKVMIAVTGPAPDFCRFAVDNRNDGMVHDALAAYAIVVDVVAQARFAHGVS